MVIEPKKLPSQLPPAPALSEKPGSEGPIVDARTSAGHFAAGNTVGALSYQKDDTIVVAECEDIARRVMREGGAYTMTSLAREVGMTVGRLKSLMATPTYRAVAAKVSEEFWGSIDDHIKDERLDSLVRANAIQQRGLTVLGEILDVVKKHTTDVKGGNVMPKATLIKAGVDAVAEARQNANALREMARGSTGGTLNITLTGKHASLIGGALKESGVNLSDVLDGYLDAEVVKDDTPGL